LSAATSSSPYFLGRSIDDLTQTVSRHYAGLLISALAVVFVAEILGMLIVLFVVAAAYVGLARSEKIRESVLKG